MHDKEKPKIPNPNQDLIRSLQMLEEMRQMGTIRNQNNLSEGVMKLQELFTQTLLDFLKTTSNGLTPTEMAFARDNQKIPAIKLIRERTGLGVVEASDMVKKWQKENGVDPFGGQR